MRIGKLWISPKIPLMRFFLLLSKIWFIPFGFFIEPIKVTGKIPHPLKPREFRDLVLHKMMFPDNILRAVFADKIAARGWVSERIGSKYNTELYDICDSPDSLKQKNYPYPYVVKTNHASKQVALVYNDADREKMLEAVQKWDAGEYNPKTEWAYHGIKRKFMVEKLFMGMSGTPALELYLIFFFGEPVLLYLVKGRAEIPEKVFLTPQWEALSLRTNYTILKDVPEKPKNLEAIIALAKQLVGDLDFLRVDFLFADGEILFSELTNFPSAGQPLFQPRSYEKYLMSEYNRLRGEKIVAERLKYTALAEQDFAKTPP